MGESRAERKRIRLGMARAREAGMAKSERYQEDDQLAVRRAGVDSEM